MLDTLDTVFFARLFINTISVGLLVFVCYYPHARHRAYAMSFLLFGEGVFVITALLHNADISMGFAFGLFAIFSMLRYRTESISIKEMTYLFLVIAIALLTAVGKMSWVELLLLNGFLCLCAWLSETTSVIPKLHEKEIIYERIENLSKVNHLRLIQDLQARTGLEITRVETLSIDYLRDTARLRIHYRPE